MIQEESSSKGYQRTGSHVQIRLAKLRFFSFPHNFWPWSFVAGESFGEPPIFIDEPYPSTAIAIEDSVVLKIKKEKFVELLDEYPGIQKKIIILFANRIYNKAITAREIINNTPETRILSFLNSFKKKTGNEDEEIEIPYTRQEIANFTGLRVETVIRTLNKMKQSNRVKIINRKLIF